MITPSITKARRIILVPDKPEGATDVSVIVMSAPDDRAAVFGPLLRSQGGEEGDVFVWVPNGFDTVPHVKEKIEYHINKIKESSPNPTDQLAAAMVVKRGFTWRALANASNMSESVSNIVFGAFAEVIAQAVDVREVSFPAEINNDNFAVAALVQGAEWRLSSGIDQDYIEYVHSDSILNHTKKSEGKKKNAVLSMGSALSRMSQKAPETKTEVIEGKVLFSMPYTTAESDD